MIKTFEKFLEDFEKLKQSSQTKKIWGFFKEEIEDIFLGLEDEISLPIFIKFGIAKNTHINVDEIPTLSSSIDIWDGENNWDLEKIEKKIEKGDILPIIRIYFYLDKHFSDNILGDVDYLIDSDLELKSANKEIKLWKEKVYNLQSNIEKYLNGDNLNLITRKGYITKKQKIKYFTNEVEIIPGYPESGCLIYLVEFVKK
jgi:hypothetical protein